jgi:putative PIN family toxin of toxin-antitoxin system
LICVVDSCVWISAFQFGGTPLEALNCAYEEHRLAICTPILNEIHRALNERFDWSDARLEAVQAEYLDRMMRVTTRGRVSGICRDPKDDMVIECAVAAGADLILTGDKDLLAVKCYKTIRILTPRQFLNEFATPPEA